MANKFICTLLLIAVCAASTSADGIVNGSSTTIKARSYVASIHTSDGKRACNGAVIDPKTVVTTAQCLADYDVSQLLVSVNNGANTVKIAKSSINPRFDYETMAHNIAVIRLAEKINTGSIPLASSQPRTGASGVVTGWSASNALVDIPETIITAKDCVSGNNSYEKGDILGSMLCGTAKIKACNPQPGSPLMSNKTLVGLVSWGYSCANSANPAVFTNIASENSWINEAVKSL